MADAGREPYELVECPSCKHRKLLWMRGLVAHTCKECGVRSPAASWRVVDPHPDDREALRKALRGNRTDGAS